MPSKIQLDENLWFLYVCLQKSDFKVIDFNAVGEATGLKAPAARMRYTRLKRHIVGGTLIGTHGTPFQGGPERITQAQGKRKKESRGTPDKEVDQGPGFIETRSGSRIQRRAKSEQESSDEYESNTEGEDDMPLAKRRPTRRTSTPDIADPSANSPAGTAVGPTQQAESIPCARPGQPLIPQIELEAPQEASPKLRVADRGMNPQITDQGTFLDRSIPLQDSTATDKSSASPRASPKSKQKNILPDDGTSTHILESLFENGAASSSRATSGTKRNSPPGNEKSLGRVQVEVRTEGIDDETAVLIKEEVED